MLRKTQILLPRSHQDTKKNNFFINGLTKMKLALKNLCALVPSANGIPLGVAKFLGSV
jgi:hypothetical protein